jgi:hypothetical protein
MEDPMRALCRFLCTSVALLGLGGGILAYGSPTWSSELDVLYAHFIGGWTEARCERHKIDCLMAKAKELEVLEAELTPAVNALTEQKGTIARDLQKREHELAANTMLLDDGRPLYAKATETGTAVRFAGREYTADALRRQLEVLYHEGPALRALVMQVRSLDEDLDKKLNDLMVKKTKVRAARDLLPSQIELARASNILGGLDATLNEVTNLSSSIKTDVAEVKDWLGTTNELIKRKVESEHR